MGKHSSNSKRHEGSKKRSKDERKHDQPSTQNHSSASGQRVTSTQQAGAANGQSTGGVAGPWAGYPAGNQNESHSQGQSKWYYSPLYNYERESSAESPWNNLAGVVETGGPAARSGGTGHPGHGYPASNATAGSGAERNGQGKS